MLDVLAVTALSIMAGSCAAMALLLRRAVKVLLAPDEDPAARFRVPIRNPAMRGE